MSYGRNRYRFGAVMLLLVASHFALRPWLGDPRWSPDFLLLALMVMKAPQVHPAPIPVETQVVQGGALIKLLSELAQDHPLMAVCCAAVLGATNGADNVRRR